MGGERGCFASIHCLYMMDFLHSSSPGCSMLHFTLRIPNHPTTRLLYASGPTSQTHGMRHVTVTANVAQCVRASVRACVHSDLCCVSSHVAPTIMYINNAMPNPTCNVTHTHSPTPPHTLSPSPPTMHADGLNGRAFTARGADEDSQPLDGMPRASYFKRVA